MKKKSKRGVQGNARNSLKHGGTERDSQPGGGAMCACGSPQSEHTYTLAENLDSVDREAYDNIRNGNAVIRDLQPDGSWKIVKHL